ncbi:aldo/keto reductase [Niabella beijingensis]|uniref:aldo/keto reductase n=1 Tax=Niabella beijingensis TaxID=2872700 RepID=UPI001CBAE8E5|nr:aldo/keto reductase [Niabella beijingensis]MBZ4190872.1 aldo/keto reductase [Niabella beijingensis]
MNIISQQKIGLGTVTFGREIDAAQSFRIMDHATAAGIFFFDTAAAYGQGASETIIGDWLQAHPSRAQQVTIATKLLPPYDAATLRQRVAESLRRLQRESIDLLFFHNWHPSVLYVDTLTALADLMQQGTVKATGASNFNGAQLDRLLTTQETLQLPKITAIQNNHNLAVSDLDAPLLSVCRNHQLAIITYSPLGAGFLTGKHSSSVEEGSRFNLVPGHQAVYFTDESRAQFQKLYNAAGGQRYRQIQWALAWALQHPHTDRVLVGARTVMHLDQALRAAAFDDTVFLQWLKPFE